MADVHTPEQRSRNMAQIRSGDTKPELRVRKLLHGLGLRYRLHVKDLPGKPDLVFRRSRVALFVNGCFWHMHHCRYGQPVPATNKDFWTTKRKSNVDRDAANREKLEAAGWHVFVVWECETRDHNELGRVLKPLMKYLSR